MASLTDIKDVLYHWVNNDGGARDGRVFNTIANAYSEKGGWEGWAQVEIANVIKANYEGLSVTREDGVYDGSIARSDLVLVNEASGVRNVIELKCQRGSARTNSKWIVQQVLDDAGKLQRTLKPEFRPAKCFAVGIAITPDAIAEVQNNANWGMTRWTGQFCKDSQVLTFWVEMDVE
ncbi:hypothetical protein CSUB01_10831 [Colletotrichum sublineola]|uniref:Uncharacterized protein n=1 Tax=Colletotrichum sublineola TaxID=1173701 RepID=A0A066XNM9_COLSU|nr:hypothetical protein CSUB01_10831 [Colletotrichum sublineola]